MRSVCKPWVGVFSSGSFFAGKDLILRDFGAYEALGVEFETLGVSSA